MIENLDNFFIYDLFVSIRSTVQFYIDIVSSSSQCRPSTTYDTSNFPDNSVASYSFMDFHNHVDFIFPVYISSTRYVLFYNINIRLTHFIKTLKYYSPFSFSLLLNSLCHQYSSNLNFSVPLRSNATFVQSFSQHINTTILRNNSRSQHHIELYSKWRPIPQQLGENYLCVWGKDNEGYVTMNPIYMYSMQ